MRIPEKERSFLRYLWWEDVNLEKLIDYEMCVHVFGGTSSPGCCNYTLQRTAPDNVSSYIKEVTNILLRSIYVDDVLKSVPSVRDALALIQAVRDLCKKGGFKLTKFISNKKDILFQIPDAFRRNGAKDRDDLPDDVICDIAINADDTTIYFKCGWASISGHNLNWLLNLNLIYKTRWTGVRSGLLISMLGRLS